MTHFYQEANDPEWPEDFETVSKHATERAAIRAGDRRFAHGHMYRDRPGPAPWWIVAEWTRNGRVVARVVR